MPIQGEGPMAIEQGVIISTGPLDSRTAWVKTVRSSACESCSSRDSCRPGGNDKSQVVEAINTAGARVGDRIQLAIHTGSVLKAMSLLYLFPIVCMLAGGLLGEWAGAKFGANTSVAAALTAFAGLALSFIIVRFLGQRMGNNEAYRPRIIRVLGHESTPAPPEALPVNCESKK